MFVQVIRGQVTDPEEVHAALNRWSEQLAAGAPGWLGMTAGVTEDGRFVALARFESEEAARRNSDRREQGQRVMETFQLFAGEGRVRGKQSRHCRRSRRSRSGGLRAGDAGPRQRP